MEIRSERPMICPLCEVSFMILEVFFEHLDQHRISVRQADKSA